MEIKRIIEGALFASNAPLSVSEIQGLFPDSGQPEKSEIKEALDALEIDYRERAVQLNEVASGYRFQIQRELSPWVSRLFEEKPQRYSRALLETLAIIAYRQPATRGEIEDIRGVTVSTNIIRTLQEREWVRVVGHKEVPGRPALYATTKQFLDYFNLTSLSSLPPLKEIQQSVELLQVNMPPSVEQQTSDETQEKST